MTLSGKWWLLCGGSRWWARPPILSDHPRSNVKDLNRWAELFNNLTWPGHTFSTFHRQKCGYRCSTFRGLPGRRLGSINPAFFLRDIIDIYWHPPLLMQTRVPRCQHALFSVQRETARDGYIFVAFNPATLWYLQGKAGKVSVNWYPTSLAPNGTYISRLFPTWSTIPGARTTVRTNWIIGPSTNFW